MTRGSGNQRSLEPASTDAWRKSSEASDLRFEIIAGRIRTSLLRLGSNQAREVGGVVGAAATFPFCNLWIGAQGTGTRRHAVADFGGDHLLRRFTKLDPSLEGANRVESARTLAAGAMSHSGSQEDAEEIGRPVRSAHRDSDAVVILYGIRGGYVTVGPSVIHQQLSVSRLEGP